MGLQISAVVTAQKKVHSDGYTTFQLAERMFGGLADPVLGLEHFTLSDDAFPARPRAGFSALTYVFEESPAGLLNRNSLGDRSEILPGSLHLSHMGRGLVHEERPLTTGHEVRGLQLQVNLSADGKKSAPLFQALAAEQIPEWKPSAAVRGRVLSGRQGGVRSPLDSPEPFTAIELRLRMRASYLARVEPGCGGLLYLVTGKLRVSVGETIRGLEPQQAIAFQADEKLGEALVEASEDAHFFWVSGRCLRQPIVMHGTFAMSSSAEISETIEAYQRGKMGRIDS